MMRGGNVDMKISLSILVFLLISCVSLGLITDFVPEDYDFFILFRNFYTHLEDLKNVPLFDFILKKEGLGLEPTIISVLTDTEEKTGVSKDILLDSLSKNVLLSAKGVTLNFDTMLSLDVNYYLEILKNIGTSSFLVLETDHPLELSKFIAGLTETKLVEDGEFFIFQDDSISIFAKNVDNFLVLGGSKLAVESAVAAYTNKNYRLVQNEVVQNLLKEDKPLLGFFKGDSFKMNMGMDLEKAKKTEYVTLKGWIEESSLRFDVLQRVDGNFEKYESDSSDMKSIPYAGNYFLGVSVSGGMEAARKVTEWFSGKSEEVEKFAEIMKDILEKSTGKVYIVGEINQETTISFFALFNAVKRDPIENILGKYGKVEDGIRIMEIANTKLRFFWSGDRLIMTNLTKQEYDRIFGRGKLSDDPAYTYITGKCGVKKDVLRIYVDLGDIIEKMVGIKVSSKLLFIQYYDDGFFKYRLEVM